MAPHHMGESWFETAMALLRGLPNPVAVVEPKTLRILDVNESAVAKFGYSRDEFLRLTGYDITPPEDHEQICLWMEAIAGDSSQVFGPIRVLTKDGRNLLMDNLVMPALHNDAVVGIGILTDVTERVNEQERNRSIFDNFPLPVWVYDPATMRFLDVNKAAEVSYGYTRDEFLSMELTQLATSAAIEQFKNLNLMTARHLSGVYQHVRKDGSRITVEIESDNIPFGGNDRARIVVAKNVTEKLALQAEAEAARRRLEEAQEIAHLGSYEFDFTSQRLYLSSEAMRIMGVSHETAPEFESDLTSWFHPGDRETINEAMRNAWPHGEYTVEVRLLRADGQARWVSARAKTTYFEGTRRPLTVTGTILDVTDTKAAERELRFLAFHDPLTNLPNRSSVSSLLEQAMQGGRFAVLYIDFDGFSEVNDSFGHSYGDAVLKMIADRLMVATRDQGPVCRWGGDEFVVIVPVANTSGNPHRRVLEQFRKALQPAYEFGGRELFITASIGVAIYPDHGSSGEELIRNADTAMYSAKKHGNTSALFRPEMYDAAKQRLEIQNGLHQALRLEQFCLYFQPLISAMNNHIVSVEALIRWRDPSHGLRLPGEFIETAEQSGLIVEIGQWVIRECCRTVRAFQSQGFDFPIAFNISSKEFEYGHILDSIDDALKSTGLEARSIMVEITESGLMRDVSRSSDIMRALRARGISIALDDFGTGYSSLGHLKNFPIDALKIDRRLVQDVATLEQDREIVTAVVHLGKATNLVVIAEGIESAAQERVLRELGCHAFQGYHYCRPLPASEFLEFARTFGRRHAV